MDAQTRANLARDVQQSMSTQIAELDQVNESIEQAQLTLIHLREKKRFISTRLTAYQQKLKERARQLKLEEQRLVGEQFDDESPDTMEQETRPLSGRRNRLNPRDARSPGVVVNVQDYDEEAEDDGEEAKAGEEHDEEVGEASLSIEELERQRHQLETDQLTLERVEQSRNDMESSILEMQKKIYVLERKRDEILEKANENRDFLVAAAQVEQQEVHDDGEDEVTVPSDDDNDDGGLEQRLDGDTNVFVSRHDHDE